jgi:hypothetical protein
VRERVRSILCDLPRLTTRDLDDAIRIEESRSGRKMSAGEKFWFACGFFEGRV